MPLENHNQAEKSLAILGGLDYNTFANRSRLMGLAGGRPPQAPGGRKARTRSVIMEKVLIVDDSIVQAAQLKSILDDDYDVTAVHTAADGLSQASSGE